MKLVNNKSMYNYLINSMNDLIEGQRAGQINQMDISVFDKVTKRATSIIALQMYEIHRANIQNREIRELESKPFDNTIKIEE